MANALQEMTLFDFLAWEPAQPVRQEFHRGHVRPVDNGRRVHGRVVANLVTALGNRLDGRPCQLFSTSMPVRVAHEAVLYPDLVLTCDHVDLTADDDALRAPLLVIEVVAAGSVAWDWSEKFALYRCIAALREYVLVDPDTRRVESFRRTDDGGWTFHDMSDGDALALPSIGCTVPLTEVFRGVDPAAA